MHRTLPRALLLVALLLGSGAFLASAPRAVAEGAASTAYLEITWTPQPAAIGEPVTFSVVDPRPDIVSWEWRISSFQYPRAPDATYTTPTATHTFTGHGAHYVTLTTQHGDGSYGWTFMTEVRVVETEALPFVVDLVLPDYTRPNLLGPGTTFVLVNEETGDHYELGDELGFDGNGRIRGTIPGRSWAHRDIVLIEATVPEYEATVQTYTTIHLLGRSEFTAYAMLTAPMKLDLSVAPATRLMPGATVLDNGEAPPADLRTDPTERAWATGRVTWANGEPVREALVTLTRAHEGTSRSVVVAAAAEDDGTFRAALPFDTPGVESPGAYLPGTHHVTGAPSLPYSSKGTFDAATAPRVSFRVDPTGVLPGNVLP